MMRMLRERYGAEFFSGAIAAVLGLLAFGPARGMADATARPADLVITDARIYTSATPELSEALAARGDRIVYVGSADGVKRYIGPKTRVEDAHGRLVIPGLVDAHLHPADIVDLDVCDIDSKPLTLRELSAFVRECVARYHPAPSKRLLVHQWNPTDGNQPDAEYPTLRTALDKASTRNPIQLLGNDGHHGAFNSLGLASAKNARGEVVGISKASLATDFAPYATLIGVDTRGEPSGAVNEDARYLINPRSMMYVEYEAILKNPQRIPERLNSVGITAIMDAMADPTGLPIWDKLLNSGKLTVRTTLAQFYDPSRTRTPDGQIDYDGMVAKAKAVRAKYAANPMLRADFIKLFADGVMEANPFAVPPTLGNAAMLEPYLQPIFATDADGHATVTGYVDTASPICIDARGHADRYQDAEQAAKFMQANGFHPGQCLISNGQLQHERAVELEYVKRMHLAGFNLHIHVIGDRALRTALDAIEAARAADGVTTTHDSLAHVQLAHPDDIVRIGRDHLYVAYTYSWANVDLDYDMTVIPFLQKMIGNSYESRHVPGSYYEKNSYPVRSTKDAGAILMAGSDAPVNTRDPQPFVNMATAVTRRIPGQPALNPSEAITIREVLEAYTINGARFLGRDTEIGSLVPGKSADFVILDRDIIALADGDHADDIANTRVLETWFRGKRVYRAKDAQARASAPEIPGEASRARAPGSPSLGECRNTERPGHRRIAGIEGRALG
ncbi:MAG: amidohydrolase family protein [Steroidobacteraceae bacterium]